MQINAQNAPAHGDATSVETVSAPVLPTATEKKAKDAAEKFEAFFISEMMRQMRRTAREFGDDSRRDRPADEMLDVSYSMVADTLAGQHAFGVADLILKQILPKSEEQAAVQPKI